MTALKASLAGVEEEALRSGNVELILASSADGAIYANDGRYCSCSWELD